MAHRVNGGLMDDLTHIGDVVGKHRECRRRLHE